MIKNDKEKHVYDGLLDLAPCDDGTLTAAVGFRSGKLYEMRPRIDRKAKTLVIDRWRPLDKELFKDPRGAGWAMRVHKQPVVGYTLLEGLMEALEKASTTLTIEQESVLGGKNAHGTIALSMPAAEDIAVTFTITSYHKEIFRVPDPITITKGTQFHPVSIKTKKTAEDVVALITATALSPSQPFELTAQLWAIAPSESAERQAVGLAYARESTPRRGPQMPCVPPERHASLQASRMFLRNIPVPIPDGSACSLMISSRVFWTYRRAAAIRPKKPLIGPARPAWPLRTPEPHPTMPVHGKLPYSGRMPTEQLQLWADDAVSNRIRDELVPEEVRIDPPRHS